MKPISIREASQKWMNCLRQKNFESMRLYTYKKDRFIEVTRKGDVFVLTESGFLHQVITLDPNTAKKQLKEAFGREFPRSTMLYLQ